jgi:very-short-patch-repair endonuclease
VSDFQEFLDIRKAYARRMPGWLAEYDRTGDMRQDAYFMDWKFTPIEREVWADIRGMGLPFYPQIPALNYFLDFANPFMKIGIECDGKAWHDYELDKARDTRLAADGWMIFRIEGHECKRIINPFNEHENDDNSGLIERFFMETSEGILTAIKDRYFDDLRRDQWSHLVDMTLFNHRSTPETAPVKLQIRKPADPANVADCLQLFIEEIMEEIRQNVA